MKKVALVFVVAVIVPSLVLAWLAVRSLRDQQFLLERQQSLLYQGIADAKARDVQEALASYQRDFIQKVSALIGKKAPDQMAKTFDTVLPKDWPLAQVGFVVSLNGELISPNRYSDAEARKFSDDNGRFLASRESAPVYNSKQMLNFTAGNSAAANNSGTVNNDASVANQAPQSSLWQSDSLDSSRRYGSSKPQTRNVMPQQPGGQYQQIQVPDDNQQQFSKVSVSEAEFRQIIGDENDGALARFVDNKLNVLLWCRPSQDPQLVFGAKLNLARLVDNLKPFMDQIDPALRNEICVALLDDNARPVALSHPGFRAPWKRPFVATEVGELLPHWEVAVYLLNPAELSQSARLLQFTLGLLIAVLVLAIGIGSLLIVTDLNRQLSLARQKTDFVSNVSHELKTPLTSIRMFSELLAEGRVTDPDKRRSYLGIITAETARLTRLINNVLDFARIDRGEKKYNFQTCDLAALVRETAESYRPNLEANGFQFECDIPESPVMVHGDRDALAQVVVNLISNAEKYSDTRKEITVRLEQQSHPLPHVEVKVLDRGMGVPHGSAEKIFEQFYRAHDSLSNGIQGSGLGLTLARQIARAHGGDVAYEPRKDGGSCFVLRLPRNPRPDAPQPTQS